MPMYPFAPVSKTRTVTAYALAGDGPVWLVRRGAVRGSLTLRAPSL